MTSPQPMRWMLWRTGLNEMDYSYAIDDDKRKILSQLGLNAYKATFMGTDVAMTSTRHLHAEAIEGIVVNSETNFPFQAISSQLEVSDFKRRPVFMLNLIKEEATFPQINQYSQGRKMNPYIEKFFILPLIEERRGENWVIYKKVPFAL